MRTPENWNWYKIIAWLLIVISLLSAVYGLYADTFLAEDVKTSGWVSLLGREYVKNLIISPLWIFVGFLFNRATEKENKTYKQKENQLYGLLKGKQQVDVIDIREIIQDKYDQDIEIEKMQNEKQQLVVEVGKVEDAELRTS